MGLPFKSRGEASAASLSPGQIANLAAWYDVSSEAGTTSNLLRIDASNRVSLLADRSGNSGTNCLCLNGVSGNYASSPDAAPLDILSDLTLDADIKADDYTPTANQALVAKYTEAGNQRSYLLLLKTDGKLELRWSADGSTVLTATSSVAVTATDLVTRLACRVTLDVDNGAGGWTVQFFTGASLSALSQLGTDVTGVGTTSVFNGTAPLTIGAFEVGTQARFTGEIYRTRVWSGIVGTVAHDANFALAGKLVSSFTESSSNAATVTINSSGDLGARVAGERDLVQLTLAKQPIYLPWSGTNYGWLNGASGNYFSTPDSAGVSVTGDLEMFARINAVDYSSGAQVIIAKRSGTNGEYLWRFEAAGTVLLAWYESGVEKNATSSATPALVDGTTYWLRVTREFSGGSATVKFYFQSDTGSSTPPATGWTQIGTDRSVASATGATDSSVAVGVGAQADNASHLSGRIFRAQVLNGIGGTVVADFDPSRYTSGTTLTASTGETWTLNGGATIVTATSLYFDGSDDYMKAAAFSLSQPETVYFVGQQVSWTGNEAVYDGGADNGMVLGQGPSTPSVRQYSGGAAARNAVSFALGGNGVVSSIFNGASSSNRLNRGVAVADGITPGANNANGFTLSALGGGTSGQSNIRTNEVAIYAAAHDTATQDRFALYAGSKWRFNV